jgi:phosphatidylcholine synthase
MPWLAFSIHVLTACGAAFALLALIAAVAEDWSTMFGWLGVALIVDAVDGPLARALNVSKFAPRWSGDVLDLVVDFTTYVFVPAYAIVNATLMPKDWSVAAGIAMVVTGALYFADRDMKTAENYFRGFPAVWNLIAFYLLLVQPPPLAVAAIVAAFAILTFVPVRFVHPLRVQRLRWLTLAALVAWAALASVALWYHLVPGPEVTGALCAIAVYFLLVGLLPARQRDT